VEHRAALECKDAVGQGQHQVEVMFDDDDLYQLTQAVEYRK
jgi:hypothetical protein